MQFKLGLYSFRITHTLKQLCPPDIIYDIHGQEGVWPVRVRESTSLSGCVTSRSAIISIRTSTAVLIASTDGLSDHSHIWCCGVAGGLPSPSCATLSRRFRRSSERSRNPIPGARLLPCHAPSVRHWGQLQSSQGYSVVSP